MPVDRGEIDAQLREIGEGERWWEQREFRDLPYILHADETIRGLANARILGRVRPRVRPGRRWLVVVTSERVICLRQERFARKQIDIAPGQVAYVAQKSRLRSHQITIDTAQRRYRMRIPKDEAFRFGAALVSILPKAAGPQLHPDLEPLSWIPGVKTVATLPGMANIVSLLSPPDNPGQGKVERLEAAVDRLQADVDRLQQQVAFLEDLLEKRAEAALITAGNGEA